MNDRGLFNDASLSICHENWRLAKPLSEPPELLVVWTLAFMILEGTPLQNAFFDPHNPNAFFDPQPQCVPFLKESLLQDHAHPLPRDIPGLGWSASGEKPILLLIFTARISEQPAGSFWTWSCLNFQFATQGNHQVSSGTK